ncbi:MAG TPA: GNAT family N-acetyltransferase [Burkholderiales bacterium]|nr:GNAT family N-acetyltransferase [Burkholderiales bacterium]
MQISGYVPGSIGRLVELHGRYYARDWRFGRYFEAKIANELGGLLARLDPARDGFWIAAENGEVVGGLAIDGSRESPAARLRFFIVEDSQRGKGLGERLMRTALDFCQNAGHRHLYLTTFAGLDAARKLYERHGFVLTEERPDRTWGVEVTEQRFDLSITH